MLGRLKTIISYLKMLNRTLISCLAMAVNNVTAGIENPNKSIVIKMALLLI